MDIERRVAFRIFFSDSVSFFLLRDQRTMIDHRRDIDFSSSAKIIDQIVNSHTTATEDKFEIDSF